MFDSISRTFSLIRQSWQVLLRDRKLILLPIMSAVTLVVVLGAFAGLGAATGSLDRLATAADASGQSGAQATPADIVLSLAMLATTYFVVMFFNSALIAVAIERLRGGNPTIGSGLRKASQHLPAILGWALIAATVGLILNALRNRADGLIGRLAIGLVGGVWAYVTFFVIPVLIVEGVGPIAAIRRSSALLRQTWGQQAAASFGFGLVYVGAALIALLPAALLFAVAPLLGVVVGVLLLALVLGTVQALEGIFKAALYDFATGSTPQGFAAADLRSAYRAL